MTMKCGNPAVSVLVMNVIYFHLPTIYIHLTFSIYHHCSCLTGFQHLFQCLSVHSASTNVSQQCFNCKCKERWSKEEGAWRQGFS